MTIYRAASYMAIFLTLPLTGCWRSIGEEETLATCYHQVDCLPDQICLEGICVCDATACSGCCDDDQSCSDVQDVNACGLGGVQCQICESGQLCSPTGDCICDVENCDGCCGEDGHCNEAPDVNACGAEGSDCSVCGDEEQCRLGACTCNECDEETLRECTSDTGDSTEYRMCSDQEGCLKWIYGNCRDGRECVEEEGGARCEYPACVGVDNGCDWNQIDEYGCNHDPEQIVHCEIVDGCPIWQLDRNCGESERCYPSGDSFECSEDCQSTCELADPPLCETGDPSAVWRCEEQATPDGSECFRERKDRCDWNYVCDPTAEDGCRFACPQVCETNGDTRCEDERVSFCENPYPGFVDCMSWSEPAPCIDPTQSCHPDGNSCCVDECFIEGETFCDSLTHGTLECVSDDDEDGCFEWTYHPCENSTELCLEDHIGCYEYCPDPCDLDTEPICEFEDEVLFGTLCVPVLTGDSEVVCGNEIVNECSVEEICLNAQCIHCPNSDGTVCGADILPQCQWTGEEDQISYCSEIAEGCSLRSPWMTCVVSQDCSAGTMMFCDPQCERECDEPGTTRCLGDWHMEICLFLTTDCNTWSDEIACTGEWTCNETYGMCMPPG